MHRKDYVEGIIIYSTGHEYFSETLMKMKLENFPFVIVDQYWTQIDTYCVLSDHHKGIYDATEHIIRCGHRNIGLIIDIDISSANIRLRIDGYEKYLSDHFCG